MRMDSRSRFWLRLQSVLLALAVLLIIGLLAWLSMRYSWQAEWSDQRHQRMPQATVELLQSLDAPLEAVVFITPDDVLHGHVEQLMQRYAAHAPDFRYRIINPDARPDLVRDMGVEASGEVIIEYQGRQERVQAPSEPRISSAIHRLKYRSDRALLFLTGHGERNLEGEANHDLGAFGERLAERGHQLQALSPDPETLDPEDTELLVIAGPRAQWMPGLRDRILDYVEAGGNLLWLVDDGDRDRLAFLFDHLGLDVLPGTVVEPRAEQLLGVDDPRFLVTDDYAEHPALSRVQGVSLLVAAQALDVPDLERGWQLQPLLRSEARHWNETGDVDNPSYQPDAGEQQGPLNLGLSLRREMDSGAEQRIVVMGDADFLSNAYVGNGANLDLGVSLVEWVASAEPAGLATGRAAQDQRLELSQPVLLVMGATFLLVVPLFCLLVAGTLWWRRRRA